MIYAVAVLAYFIVGYVISGVMKANDDTYHQDDDYYYVCVPLLWPLFFIMSVLLVPFVLFRSITDAVANFLSKGDK